MTKVIVAVSLDVEDVVSLEKLAKQHGKNRSEIVREALRSYKEVAKGGREDKS